MSSSPLPAEPPGPGALASAAVPRESVAAFERALGAPLRAVELYRPALEPQFESALARAVPGVRQAARNPRLIGDFRRLVATAPPRMALPLSLVFHVPVAAPLSEATRATLRRADYTDAAMAQLEADFAARQKDADVAGASTAPTQHMFVHIPRALLDVTLPVADDAPHEPIAAVTMEIPTRDPFRHTQALLPTVVATLVRHLPTAATPRNAVWEWAYACAPGTASPTLYLRLTTRRALDARHADAVRLWELRHEKKKRRADSDTDDDDDDSPRPLAADLVPLVPPARLDAAHFKAAQSTHAAALASPAMVHEPPTAPLVAETPTTEPQ